MQGGVPSHLVKLAVSATSPVTWQKITQVVAFEPPGEEAARIPVTTYGDTRQKFIPGLPDSRAMRVRTVADMDPDSNPWLETILQLAESKAVAWWRYEIPVDLSGTQYIGRTFSGRVLMKDEIFGDPNSRIEFEFRVEPVSDVIYDGEAGSSEIG